MPWLTNKPRPCGHPERPAKPGAHDRGRAWICEPCGRCWLVAGTTDGEWIWVPVGRV